MASLPTNHLRRPFIGYLLVSLLLCGAGGYLGKIYRFEASLEPSWQTIFVVLTGVTLWMAVTAVGAILGASLWVQSRSHSSFAVTVVYGTLFFMQFMRVFELQKTWNAFQGLSDNWMILSAFIAGLEMLTLGLIMKRTTPKPVSKWAVAASIGGGAVLLLIMALITGLVESPPFQPNYHFIYLGVFSLLSVGAVVFALQAVEVFEGRRDGVSIGLVLMVMMLATASLLSVFIHSDATTVGSTVLEILGLAAVPFGFAVDGVYAIRRMDIYERGGSDEVMRDPLTGLANRRALELSSRMLFADCLASGRPLSVLMLDIDHFKMVNDLHGHAAGDEVLRRFARIVGETVGGSDVAARYGGEEFLVVMPGAPLAPAMRLAERIRSQVEGTSFEYEKGALSLTVSVGVATAFPGEAAGVDKLISTADKNLYRAKRRGRNCVLANPLPGEEDAAAG